MLGATGADLPTKPGDLKVGSHLGRYRIDGPVGRGGMGVVYRAFDAATNRHVALKLLADGLPEALRERFLKECEAEARIRHEHVMPVYDQGWATDTRPYFTMELLYEPVTLDQVIDLARRGKLGSTWPRIRRWAHLPALVEDVLLPVIEGIAVANVDERIQHRDLKPENVLIDLRTRRAYVIDFGICRSLDEPDPEAGKVIGTPRFLSPEQAYGRTDPRTDVWGLGALLRYAITGEPPLEASAPYQRREVAARVEALNEAEAKAKAAGETAKAQGYAQRRAQLEAPDLRTMDDLIRDAREGRYAPLPANVSPAYLAIVRKAMAADPERRYGNARALAQDLRAWLEGGRVAAHREMGGRGAALDTAVRWARRHRATVAGAVGGLVAGLIAGFAAGRQPPAALDYRVADAKAQLAELTTAATAPLPAPAPAFAHTLRSLLADDLALRVERVGSAEDPDAKALATALDPVAVRLLGLPPAPPRDLVTGEAPTLEALPDGRLPLAAGWWALRSPPLLDAPMRLDGDVELAFPELPQRLAERMHWVLVDGSPVLMAERPITYGRYEEWISYAFQPGERESHLPSTGFEREPGSATNWIAKADLRDEPVVGIRPEDAISYAAWRSEVDGLTLDLPTAAEWEAMAGRGLLAVPGSDLAIPGVGATPDGSRVERASRGPRAARSTSLVGPYGHEGHLGGERELVRSGEALVLKGGRTALLDEALARSTALVTAADGRAGFVFRLVHRATPPADGE
ncbi:MAG: protein kinase [Planctomycetes bacterium]|nr:protein kinase [Planctomycetota bacterium]